MRAKNEDSKKLLHAQATTRALKEADEVLSITKFILKLLAKSSRFFFAFLKAIPPIRLLIDSIENIASIVGDVVNKKHSFIKKASNVGVAATSLGLVFLSFFAPITATAAMITGAAISVAKDSVTSLNNWKNVGAHKKIIQQHETIIAKKNQPKQMAALRQNHEKLKKESAALKKKAVKKTIKQNLGLLSLIGVILLPIPGLTPIGGILLLASAVLGLAHASYQWAAKKQDKKNAVSQKKLIRKNKSSEKEIELSENNTSTHASLSSTSTTCLSIAEKTHDAQHSTQEEALHELQELRSHLTENPAPKKEDPSVTAHKEEHPEMFFVLPHEDNHQTEPAHKTPYPKKLTSASRSRKFNPERAA